MIPAFVALERLIAGKPETQFSAAEEPDWKAVHDACLVLLGQSKDLRVAVILCLALLKLEGAVGLRDGLALLKGSLERYWPDLYPKLDPEENNDPLERINIIASVSTPLGTFGDPLRFLQRLREIPLANSPQMGWFSLADIMGDKITLPNGQEKPSASAAQIKAAFRDTKPEELEGCGRAILDSIVLAKDIDRFLMETVGPAQAPDMAALTSVLTDIQKNLAPYMSKVPGQMQAEGRSYRYFRAGRICHQRHDPIETRCCPITRPNLRILCPNRTLESAAAFAAARATTGRNGFSPDR